MRHLAVCAALVATAGLVVEALARPSSDSPTSGGISQPVTLTLLGFTPVKKPKVQLVPHAGSTGLKTTNMKVESFTATDIHADVTGGLAGIYDVLVKPGDRGVAPVTLPDTFTILVPAPASADPATAPGNTSVTIHGSRFGAPKGRVTIGGKKAKVKHWADDAIVLVVPKTAAAGAQSVVVTNKAGSSDGALTLTVTASAHGGGAGDEFLRADLSGKGHFEVTSADPKKFSVTYDPVAFQLTFGGTTQPTKGYPNLIFSMLPLDVTRATPYDIGLLPAFPVTTIATLAYQEVVGTPKIRIASPGLPGAALTITITGWDGTFLEGTFTGTLVDSTLGGAPPIVVTNGVFKVRRATGH